MSKTESPKIIFVEDDPDQMELLTQFALDEIQEIIEKPHTTDAQRELLQGIKVIKVTNVHSLEKAVDKYKDIFLVILDCNLPDIKGGKSNDQLVKTNHRITGRHRAVDIVGLNLPNTPITLISTLNRFKNLVYKYYEPNEDVDITFINKSDQEMIQRNMAYHLRRMIR